MFGVLTYIWLICMGNIVSYIYEKTIPYTDPMRYKAPLSRSKSFCHCCAFVTDQEKQVQFYRAAEKIEINDTLKLSC